MLTGGSAAAVYVPQKYMSYDADFILDRDDSLENVQAALEPIGFRRDGRSRIFYHPKSKFTVDFPKGPLSVAGDYISRTNVLSRGGVQLRILTRVDCVRDRLSHFYFWNDYSALNAAVAVAAQLDAHEIESLREWTQRESPALLEKFAEFQKRRTSLVQDK
ncbi:MAG TPA: hypothetical protein VHK24_09950 [Steroidobacter sp.]|nr:hypothetical protein [Steroidobacter sp.]